MKMIRSGKLRNAHTSYGSQAAVEAYRPTPFTNACNRVRHRTLIRVGYPSLTFMYVFLHTLP